MLESTESLANIVEMDCAISVTWLEIAIYINQSDRGLTRRVKCSIALVFHSQYSA